MRPIWANFIKVFPSKNWLQVLHHPRESEVAVAVSRF